jgi:CHAT domain-containing protein/Tfp pilus assembly protein PilF
MRDRHPHARALPRGPCRHGSGLLRILLPFLILFLVPLAAGLAFPEPGRGADPPAPAAVPPEAAALADSVDGLYAGDEYAEGLRLARYWYDLTRASLGDSHPQTAAAQHARGIGLLGLGRLQAAAGALDSALAMRRQLLGEEDPAVAQSLHGLARLCWRRGDVPAAESYMRRALAIARGTLGEDHLDTAQYMYGLGVALMQQGDYAAAEPFLRRALAVHRALLPPGHSRVANNLDGLAVLLKRRGDDGAAEPLYREALAIHSRRRPLPHRDVARCLSNLAGVLCDMRRYDEAEPLLREALAIRQRLAAAGQDSMEVAHTLHNLALVVQRDDRPAEAEGLIREALAMTERLEGGDGLFHANLQHNLAQALVEQQRLSEARLLFPEVLATYRRLLGEEHPHVAWVLTDDGFCHLALGEVAEAERHLERAAAIFETARLRAGGGTARATFQTSPYELLAAARLVAGHQEQAWTAAERALGRALADLLFTAGRRQLSEAETAREDELRWHLGRLEGQVGTLQAASARDTTRATAARLIAARNELLEVEAEWSTLQHELATRYPVSEGRALPLAEVQACLAPPEAILGWLLAEIAPEDHAIWGYVVRDSGPVAWRRLDVPDDATDGEARADRAQDFRDALDQAAAWPFRVTDTQRITAAARELYDEWIAPLTPQLAGVRSLRVVAAGPLIGIPVEVLVDSSGTYLGESMAVSYTPSATIHAWLARSPEQEKVVYRTALLLGDPPTTPAYLAAMEREETGTASAEPAPLTTGPQLAAQQLRDALAGNAEALAALPRLRWTREEITRLAPLFPATRVLLGPDASEQELAALTASGELGRFDVIHLAAHALVDEEAPARSALVLARTGLGDPVEAALAGRPIQDGLFSVKEIARNCRLRAELVTLSGCQTGLGREAGGEGYLGLAHAFLQAGARSLLVSLWRVEDEATCLLMDRFYRNLLGREGGARPLSKVDALREAKAWLRSWTDATGAQPYRHPAYWSGFILIGSPR